jgi:Spy/CpxP family protein refolding chaperone
MSESSASRKAALWVGIVFLLGAAVGVMAGYGYERWSVSAAHAQVPEPVRRAQRVDQLTKELSLTPDQAKHLDQILMQVHTELKTVRDQSDAQVEQIRQKGRDQIRAILTPEQKPNFEEFLRNLDEQRKRNASH